MNRICSLCVLLIAAAHAATVPVATEGFVTNRISASLAAFAETGTVQNAHSAESAGSALYASTAGLIDGFSADDIFQSATNAAVSVVSATNTALMAALSATNQAMRAELRSATQSLSEWHVSDQDITFDPLRFVTNGMVCADFNNPPYPIGADLAGWPDGAALFVRATTYGLPYTVGPSIRLVGRDSWPTNDFQAVWWRSGTNVFVNVLSEAE